VRSVCGRLSTVSRLHAVSLRLPRDSAVSRLRGRLLMQGQRRRGLLRSMQTGILCTYERQSRRLLVLLLLRRDRSLHHCQIIVQHGESSFFLKILFSNRERVIINSKNSVTFLSFPNLLFSGFFSPVLILCYLFVLFVIYLHFFVTYLN